MSRSDHRGLLGSTLLLGSAALLLELLAFRIAALAFGWSLSMLAALLGPATMAFGALTLGRCRADATDSELCRRACHLAASGGAGVVVGSVGIIWANHTLVFASDIAGGAVVGVAIASLLLPTVPTGAAMALLMRLGSRRIGRFGFAEALGGALGCLLLPLASWAGFPRTMVAVGLLYAGAAFLLGRAARGERVRTALVATLPLVVVALVAGDVGEPWMRLRGGYTRLERFDRYVWTSLGAVAVEPLEGPAAELGLDRAGPRPMAHAHRPGRKPPPGTTDIGYDAHGGAHGPALVIASAGGHEVDVALAHQASRVDVVEIHPGLDALLRDPAFVEYTGNPWADERVVLHAGGGRASLDRLPRDYENVVLVGPLQPDQAGPRFLSRDHRFVTAEALHTFMTRLDARGRLTAFVAKEKYPSVVAGVLRVLGLDVPTGLSHVVVCTGVRAAVVVASRSAFDDEEASRLKARCTQRKLTVALPLKEARPGPAGDQVRAANHATLAAIDNAVVATEDLPFTGAPPPPETLPTAAVSALEHLVPEPLSPSRQWRLDPQDMRPPDEGREGLAFVAFLVAALVLVVGAVRRADVVQGARPPATLRGAMPCFGAALALCAFSLGDLGLRVTGDGAFAWALVVPMTLVGVGSGRLLVDAIEPLRARRITTVTLAVGLAGLLASFLAGPRLLTLAELDPMMRWSLTGVVLFGSGFLLGFPAAAVLQRLAAWERGSVAWGWGMHAAGWALGSALAALAVSFLGVARLQLPGIAAFAIGAALVIVGLRAELPGSPRLP